jgi:outer membrane biogenesis lipoprotein LolB
MNQILFTCLSASALLFACNNEKKTDKGKKDETKTESTETNSTTAPPDSAAQA